MEFLASTTFGILLIAIFTNTVLAVLVFRNNPKSTTNAIYGFLSFLISVWLLVLYIAPHPLFLATSLLWTRLSIFIATPMSMMFFLLAHTLPSHTLRINKRMLIVILISTAVIMIINISPYAFTHIDLSGGSLRVVPGPGIMPFSIFSTFFSLAAVYVLFRRMKGSSGVERQQFGFMMFGILAMLGLVTITILIPVLLFEDHSFVPLSPLYTLIFLGMTAYAIVKHQLFNIKVIATEILTVVLAIVTLLEALFSDNLSIFIFRISIFLLALSFGILLIRSVRKEVEQREQLQSITNDLATANAELKRLDKAKSEFVSIASHQLRTPLTAIKGYLSLALEGTYGAISDKLQKPIRNVYNSNERLLKLVNDLLNLSRIQSRKVKLEIEEVDIGRMVQSVIDELKIKAEEKNLELVFKQEAPSLPTLQLDRERMRNVILNLVDNAIRYTKKGTIEVALKMSPKKESVLVSVKDSGEGMTKEEISKLFESFSRGQAGMTLSTEGAGLGLYIAKRFVQMHKGKIWAASEGQGKGSTFFIELPIDF